MVLRKQNLSLMVKFAPADSAGGPGLRPCRPVVRSPGLGVRSTTPRFQFQFPFHFVPEGLFSLHHVPALRWAR